MVFTVSTVAGWFFGIPGMLISIPVASVIYGLYRDSKKKQSQQGYQQVPQQPVQDKTYKVLPKNAPNHFE